MIAVLAAARKDVVRRLRDRIALALWLGIPLVLGGLISLAMGGPGGGVKPRAKVLVVDRDDTLLSGLLLQALSSERAQVFEAEEVEETAGRERVLAGEASALLVIPAGFGEAVLRETPTVLELTTNPAQRILPGMVEEALEILGELVFYLHRIVGDDLRSIAAGPPDGHDFFAEARVADFSVQIQRRVERLQQLLFPPVIEVERVVRDAPAEGEQAPSLPRLFFPSMLLMALFFAAQGMGEDVWHEKARGTLRRASTTPGRARPWLVGKLLAAWALMLVIALVAGLLGCAAFGVEPARALAAALWASAIGVLLTLGMFALNTLAGTQRGASLVTNIVLFPLLMLGGSFFPFEAMPSWIGTLGRWTPNGWGLTVLKAILSGSAQPASLAASCAALALLLALLFVVCERRIGGSFSRS